MKDQNLQESTIAVTSALKQTTEALEAFAQAGNQTVATTRYTENLQDRIFEHAVRTADQYEIWKRDMQWVRWPMTIIATVMWILVTIATTQQVGAIIERPETISIFAVGIIAVWVSFSAVVFRAISPGTTAELPPLGSAEIEP